MLSKTKKILTKDNLLLAGAVVFLFFISAFAAIIIFYNSSNPLSGFSFDREQLMKFAQDRAPKAYIVQSGSMEPAIDTGSLIISLPRENYRQGEVITFEQNGKLITHRAIFKRYDEDGAYFMTAGDANEDFDNWQVREDKIVGEVFLHVPYAGYIANKAKTPQGFILMVVVPATIVIYEELKALFKELLKLIKRMGSVISTRTIAKRRNLSSEISSLEDSVEMTENAKNLGRHDGKNNEDQESDRFWTKKAMAFVPITGAFLAFTALSASYFLDLELTQNNIFSAAETFPESPSPTPTPSDTQGVNSGDVVINEIMWMGSQGNAADEWIELRNMTNNSIDLSNWVVENLGSGSGAAANITIPTGHSIASNGFFLISNDTKETSIIDVDTDFQTSSVSLANPGEQLVLKDNLGNTIDAANGTDGWFAGEDPPGLEPEKSMERNELPGNGTVSTNWHTATSSTNIDAGSDEVATPRAPNSSP